MHLTLACPDCLEMNEIELADSATVDCTTCSHCYSEFHLRYDDRQEGWVTFPSF